MRVHWYASIGIGLMGVPVTLHAQQMSQSERQLCNVLNSYWQNSEFANDDGTPVAKVQGPLRIDKNLAVVDSVPTGKAGDASDAATPQFGFGGDSLPASGAAPADSSPSPQRPVTGVRATTSGMNL